MGRAAKNYHRSLLDDNTPTETDEDKSNSTRIMPPPRAAADATNVVTRKQKEDMDDNLIARTDSAMAKNDMLIPGDNYSDAVKRKNERGPVLPTMDKHGVEDIVKHLSK